MIQKKRHHPLTIVFDLWGYVKGAFIPAIFLFIFNYNSETFIMKYGRYALVIITILVIIFFIFKWLTYQYEVKEHAFHLYSGYLDKEEQIVPYDKIQNINRKTSALHRLLHMTSIQFETAMTGENATVIFNAVTEQEAEKMENVIHETTIGVSLQEEEETEAIWQEANKRTIHFTPTTKDTIRASFTSFSFLILIPILVSIFVKTDQLFDIEDRAEGIVTSAFQKWWVTAIVIIAAILVSMLIGIIRIYLKYGKYEISSDRSRIYITQGILNETSFSIAKQNVQAIEMEQSLMKRMLGIVEITLISAGNFGGDDDDLKASSLYPFLKEQRAYAILEEILPAYQVTEEMTSFTPPALWLRLLRGVLFYLIPAGLLFYFKPTIWGISQAWWLLILLLFIVINLGIWLRYRNSSYTMNDEFIQKKEAALGSSLFLSKREKIIEVIISRSFIQKKLGLASLEIVNRSRPVKHTKIADIPLTTATSFYHWYRNRAKEIEVE